MKTFSQSVDMLRYGTLGEELTKELNALVAVCTDKQKVGELTLTLKLKPGKGGQIEVFDEIKVKAPKAERPSSIVFATVENNLVTEDPRQRKLDLRQVENTGQPPALRNVDSDGVITELRKAQ